MIVTGMPTFRPEPKMSIRSERFVLHGCSDAPSEATNDNANVAITPSTLEAGEVRGSTGEAVEQLHDNF